MKTRQTLLRRVRDPRDAEAWEEFYALYGPLLLGYARRHGLPLSDAEEVRDHCLAVLAEKLRTFEYEGERGGFQRWLHRIVRNRVIDQLRQRREVALETAAALQAPDPAPGPDAGWEAEWRAGVLRAALEEARRQVAPRTWRIFALLLEEERSVPEVCAALGVTANQVYKARQRALAVVRAAITAFEDAG